ncbi:MAG: hypothetical protein MJ231_08140 [bacterium]|nr:hypothetical protein [bacterium]
MINNITNVDPRTAMEVKQAATSKVSVPTPPVLSFKIPLLKEKAQLRVKKFKRSDGIIIPGEIEDDYVDIVEEDEDVIYDTSHNFFQSPPQARKRKMKYLKESYIIDYIQSPRQRCGYGVEAVKQLAEKAMFDPKIQGRIVTFSAPVCKESSPALFFYKIGFRLIDPSGNEYMKECLIKNIPDIPPRTGMMYLPKSNLHKLLRYGELF